MTGQFPADPVPVKLATSDLPNIVSTPPNFTTYPTDRPLAVNDLNVYAVANYLAVV